MFFLPISIQSIGLTVEKIMKGVYFVVGGGDGVCASPYVCV